MWDEIRDLYETWKPIWTIAWVVLYAGLSVFSMVRGIIDHEYLIAAAALAFGLVAIVMTALGVKEVLFNEFLRQACGYTFVVGLGLVFMSQAGSAMEEQRPLKRLEFGMFLLMDFDTKPGISPQDRELAQTTARACIMASDGSTDLSMAIDKTMEVATTRPGSIVIKEARSRWLSKASSVTDPCLDTYKQFNARYPDIIKGFEFRHHDFVSN